VSNRLFARLVGSPALYLGYKRRNKALDKLIKSPPAHLDPTDLLDQTFHTIRSLSHLRSISNYLLQVHHLLERVIRARMTHQEHFYSKDLDYGHEVYLQSLLATRVTVLQALERLEQRTQNVLLQNQAELDWIRQCQSVNEGRAEMEKKRRERDTKLLERHLKKDRLRKTELTAIEEAKTEDAELEKAWYEAQTERWDPTDKIIAVERATRIELMKQLLALPTVMDNESSTASSKLEAIENSGSPSPLPTNNGARDAAGIRSMSAPQIGLVQNDVAEVRVFLFCRKLLSRVTCLPQARKATSVERFLEDESVGDKDIRDLCLELGAQACKIYAMRVLIYLTKRRKIERSRMKQHAINPMTKRSEKLLFRSF